jgi:integrase/recombinase XerD
MGDMAGLFDQTGGRKYVCASERQRFLAVADRAGAQTRAFALVLAFSGCRISEALSVTAGQLDPETNRLILRTLKRRRQVFRAVPIPAELMRELTSLAEGKRSDERLWTCCRQTAWRRIKRLMTEAGIRGAQATAKGLRHGFGIANAEENVPPSLTQRWMGHARLETTAIYQHAIGDEERAFARRIWRRSGKRRH